MPIRNMPGELEPGSLATGQVLCIQLFLRALYDELIPSLFRQLWRD